MVIEFAWLMVDEVLRKVSQILTRADKLGVPLTIDVSLKPTRVESKVDPITGFDVLTQFGEIVVGTDALVLAGWKLVGVITPIPTDDGTVILYPTAVPGETLPANVRDWTLRCEHCDTVRFRKETFIVQHTDGTVKQVGRQCIRDFLGHDVTAMLSTHKLLTGLTEFVSRDLLTGGGESYHRTSSLHDVLVVSSAMIRAFGWTSAGAAKYDSDLTATKDHVGKYMFELNKYAVELRKEHPITDADKAAADACIAFWAANTDQSDYAMNAQLLAEHNVVIAKAFGLAVSLMAVYQKNESKRAASKLTYTPGFIGDAGNKLSVKATVIEAPSVATQFGVSYRVTLRAESGHRIIWWSSKPLPNGVDAGSVVTLAGTVKSHTTYKDQDQTVMTRCKFV